MNETGSGERPDSSDEGSWTTETLPLSLRKELLERDLKRLGFRKAASRAGASGDAAGHQQPQPQGGSSSHPQADGEGGGHSE